MRKASSVALVLASLAVPAGALAVQGHYLPEGVSEGAQRAWSKLTAGRQALEDAPPGLAESSATQDGGADELPPAAAGGSNARGMLGRRRASMEPTRIFPVDDASRRPVGQMNARMRRDYDRLALTRMLQRELRRVGCYSGEISGVWTPSTRGAVTRFTARANARLPVDRPDDALLAMVRSHDNRVCGPCRDEEALSRAGQCIPAVLVDRGAKRPPEPPPTVRRTAVSEAPVASSRPPATAAPVAALADPPGRMRLAGPKTVDVAPQSPRGTRSSAPDRSDRTRTPRRTREAGARKLGAWIFHDAPVDRLLAR